MVFEMELKPGDEVYLPRLGKKATVVKVLSPNKVELQVGNLTLKASAADCKLSATPTAQRRRPSPTGQRASGVQRPLHKRVRRAELDLHGKTIQEARELLRDALDQAVRNNLASLVVIHGKGSGALRSAVHNYVLESGLAIRLHFDGTNSGETLLFFE